MFPYSMVHAYNSFFSIAVIKHHDEGNLQNKQFIWSYNSRMLASMMIERDCRHGYQNSKLRAHIFNYKQEAKRTKRECWPVAFEASKHTSSDILSPARPNLLSKPKLPSEDQVFRYLSLWTNYHTSLLDLQACARIIVQFHLVQFQKSPQCLSLSTLFTSQKFKFLLRHKAIF